MRFNLGPWKWFNQQREEMDMKVGQPTAMAAEMQIGAPMSDTEVPTPRLGPGSQYSEVYDAVRKAGGRWVPVTFEDTAVAKKAAQAWRASRRDVRGRGLVVYVREKPNRKGR